MNAIGTGLSANAAATSATTGPVPAMSPTRRNRTNATGRSSPDNAAAAALRAAAANAAAAAFRQLRRPQGPPSSAAGRGYHCQFTETDSPTGYSAGTPTLKGEEGHPGGPPTRRANPRAQPRRPRRPTVTGTPAPRATGKVLAVAQPNSLDGPTEHPTTANSPPGPRGTRKDKPGPVPGRRSQEHQPQAATALLLAPPP